MIITIIPQDNKMCVDGLWKDVDLTHFDENIVAIHVNNGVGFAQTNLGLNPLVVQKDDKWLWQDKNPMGGEITEKNFSEMEESISRYNSL